MDERLDLLPDGKAGIEMREYARERIEGVRCSHDLVERLVADGTMGPEYAEQFSARTLVERIQERSRAQSIIKSRKALQALMHEMEGLLAPDEVAFIESEPFPPYALHEANAVKEYVVNMRSLKTAGAVNSVTRIRALPDVRERMQAAKDSLAWSGRIDAMIEKLRQPASGPVTDSQVLKDDEVRMIRGLPSIAKRRDHVIRFIREKVLEYLFRNELSLADVEGNIL